MTFQFEPKKEIREFDFKQLVGKIATIELCYLSEDKKKQYVQIRQDFGFKIGDWVKTLGEKDTKINANVRGIAAMPKSCSKPIVTDKYIIFGTRCKSYEYAEVINETYKVGGFIAKNKEWNLE